MKLRESNPAIYPPLTPEENQHQQEAIKAKKELFEALEKSSLTVRAEIITMTDDGAVVKAEFWNHAKLTAPPDAYFKGAVFIYGIPDNLVDGSIWTGKVFPTSNYKYITTLGNRATVLGFAASLELAARHQ